jgi:hypothetical protein
MQRVAARQEHTGRYASADLIVPAVAPLRTSTNLPDRRYTPVWERKPSRSHALTRSVGNLTPVPHRWTIILKEQSARSCASAGSWETQLRH